MAIPDALRPSPSDIEQQLILQAPSGLVKAAATDDGELKVDVTVSIPPTGLATSALQTTGNTSLAAIAVSAAAGSTAAKQDTETAAVTAMSAKLPAALGRAAATASMSVAMCTEDAAKFVACNTGAVVVASSALPSGAATETTLAAASAKLPATLGTKSAATSLAVALSTEDAAKVPALGAAATSASTPVNIASDQVVPVKKTCSTGTLANVASSASNVTLLASNANRRGASIVNDSTAILYLKCAATASATSFTVAIPGSTAAGLSYYEVPFGYTGIIDGIWASANGSARVTEFS